MEEIAKLANQLGRYRLVSTLGQGGMGTIWLAVAGGLGEFRKLLVVKELRWDLTRNHRFVEMFLDEAKLAARLNHPNVVQTLEAGAEDDRYFLAMEFLDGQPLSEVMQRSTLEPALSLAVRLRILCGALAGLHYAHELRDYDGTELQIVHRDISPHNVFITYDGQVKVVDFGIAKAADAETLTQPGMFKGKFAYASPEQIESRPVDRRADIFAMGVLLWELVTLQRFAKGKPTHESFNARILGTEPRLSEVDYDVDPLLAEICDRAMHVDPRERFASAEQLRLALEQYLFLNGDREDASALAKVMQSVFASERANMHRVIDNHLKAADCSESLVRQLRPLPSASTPVSTLLGEEDPTTVADLSELVESSRNRSLPGKQGEQSSATNAGWKEPLRPKSSGLWIAAGVVAAAAAIATYVLATKPSGGAGSAASAPAPAPAAVPAAAVAGSAAAPPSTTAPLPAQPSVAQGSAVQTRKPASADSSASAPTADQPASSLTEPTKAERRARRGARPRGAEESDEAGEPIPGLSFGMFGGGDDDEAKPSEEPDDEPAHAGSLRVDFGDESDAKDSPPPEIGEDLRRLRKEQRRGIDTEDPFQ